MAPVFKVLEGDEALLERLVELRDYPLEFVLWAFPWGEAHGPLAGMDGPDTWQRQELASIGRELRAGGDLGCLILRAIRSGHGVGKSALVSWLIIWALTTFRGCRGVVTAMTDTQLRTKTWAELSTWHHRFIAGHLFQWTATGYGPGDSEVRGWWRIDAVPWSETNPSAFQGLHNLGKRLIVLFDEAAQIHPTIWEATEGALTDSRTQIIWMALGNMTTTSGPFYKAFTSDRWECRTVDSRESKFSNKQLIARWIEKYGEDSDFVRVRVRGLPPRGGVSNFIGPDLVFAARRRQLRLEEYGAYPVVLGVDPARFGGDLSVIAVRQGPKLHKLLPYSGLDGGQLAARVVDEWRRWRTVSAICVDAIGVGSSPVDFLKRVPGCPLIAVNVGTKAVNVEDFFNLRSEIYDKTRRWLENDAEMPDEEDLDEELTAVNYGLDARGRVQLEDKDDVKDRIGRSPDKADALSLTFVAGTMAAADNRKNIRVLPVKRRVMPWGQVA